MCQSRADGLGLKVVVGDESSFTFDKDVSGVLLQYPATDGSIHEYKVMHLLSCLQITTTAITGHHACVREVCEEVKRRHTVAQARCECASSELA